METTPDNRRASKVDSVSPDELGTLPRGARWVQLPLDLYFPTGEEEILGHDGESSSTEEREHGAENALSKTPQKTSVE